MNEHDFCAISDGHGQFVSAFSVHASGMKGTSVTFHFCEKVPPTKRSAALVYPHDQAVKVLDFLRFITVGADAFVLTKLKWDGDDWQVAT